MEPVLPDSRQAGKVRFSPLQLLIQRLLSLIAGKEDLNDCVCLEKDPGFLMALGSKQVASASTLCRFERSIDESVLEAGNRFLLDSYFRYGNKRKYIFIDVDNTPVELYGHQKTSSSTGITVAIATCLCWPLWTASLWASLIPPKKGAKR